MVYLPEPSAYVAVGIPYDLYFVGGRYYYLRGSNWFWAPGYGGPWNYVAYSSVPPGLRKFKPARLHGDRPPRLNQMKHVALRRRKLEFRRQTRQVRPL